MLETLERVARSVSDEDRREAIRVQADMVLHGGLFEGIEERDRRDLEDRHVAVISALEKPA